MWRPAKFDKSLSIDQNALFPGCGNPEASSPMLSFVCAINRPEA